ncbi:SDR family oxidoreductase [Paraferrimonas sedimenticola]|uniref:NAD(P)-dependent oxidoreductase n=1 Tax=Paraferrimonas sedimenticola TaxID=375674 RepID=A0AA37RQT9_9GAMM|nr:NAD(P)H-binding protein [Paraferrimonas sedimenticola]GLP95135.1 NAD(P)-dependent oxidoreductase [Paraferrimonas sedimenticola]
MLLLTGANGKTGREVLKALVAKGETVRAFIRQESQWPDLQALGASEYAVGDMADGPSIDSAMEGCQKVVHIGPPMHPDEKAMTQCFVELAKKHQIEHFIYYSVMHPLRRDVRHHSLKLDAEEVLIESMLPYTIVQPIRYMQHLLPIWNTVVETGVHAMPFNTQVKFNVVDLKDLAEATAIIATTPGHLYATYEFAGPESLSQQDMAEIISDVIGRPVSAQAVTLEQVADKARARGFNEDRVKQMQIMNKHYDECGFLGNPNVLSMVLGRSPTRFRAFVERLNR